MTQVRFLMTGEPFLSNMARHKLTKPYCTVCAEQHSCT